MKENLLKTKEDALKEIDELRRQIKIKPFSRMFCCMHDSENNYVCSFENLDKILENYIEKVAEITKKYNLGEEMVTKFKQDSAEILYNAAIQRNESDWADYFLEKYKLKIGKE